MPATKVSDLSAMPKAGTPYDCRAIGSHRFAIEGAGAEDNGGVWVSYNTPEYLQHRHGFPAELMGNLAGVRAVVSTGWVGPRRTHRTALTNCDVCSHKNGIHAVTTMS